MIPIKDKYICIYIYLLFYAFYPSTWGSQFVKLKYENLSLLAFNIIYLSIYLSVNFISLFLSISFGLWISIYLSIYVYVYLLIYIYVFCVLSNFLWHYTIC